MKEEAYMKKILTLLFLLLLVAACGPSGTADAPAQAEPETAETTNNMDFAAEAVEPTATAEAVATEVVAETPTAETETAVDGNNGENVAAVTVAETPAEAAEIRPQDWVKGAEDPLVAIVEYGDFQ